MSLRSIRFGVLLLCGALWMPVWATTLGPASQAGLQQKLGAALPLTQTWQDQHGSTHALADYAGGAPILLVPTWYRCSNLCGALLTGTLQSLRATALQPGRDYRLVLFSIDAQETPADARQRATDFAGFNAELVDSVWLTGSAERIAALQRAIGFSSQYDGAQRQYIHPAVLVVADAQGKVSAYLPGVRPIPSELSAALQAARQAQPWSLSQQVALICAGFDQHVGRYSGAVFNALRAAALLAALALGGWLWRRHRLEGLR